MMDINKNNTNYNVKDAIDALNTNVEKHGSQPEYRYGNMLNNR